MFNCLMKSSKKNSSNKWLVILIKQTEPDQYSCFLVHDSGCEYFTSCNNTAVLFATGNILVCYLRTSLSSSYCYLIVILLLSFILNQLYFHFNMLQCIAYLRGDLYLFTVTFRRSSASATFHFFPPKYLLFS